jgi:anthranilate synthase component 1
MVPTTRGHREAQPQRLPSPEERRKEHLEIRPDRESFELLAREAEIVPVYTEVLGDTLTPVSALIRLGQKEHLFLLESVDGGERWGRYSFLGFDPWKVWEVRGEEVLKKEGEELIVEPHLGDPLKSLREILPRIASSGLDGLPRFWGGAVGYIGYDMVRFMERLPYVSKPALELPDASMMLTDSLLIFDNLRHTVKILVLARPRCFSSSHEAYGDARERIRRIWEELLNPDEPPSEREIGPTGAELNPISNMGKEAFLQAVVKAREQILDGEAIQVVLSQRFQMRGRIDPISVYRALRFINPSPYLFFIKSPETVLVGSSPEVMVRLEGETLHLRPIAGTRRRGKDEREDRALADELLRDPKERAEHVMLVDLGRNDLGRVARTGTVQMREFMTVERYSHVMHLVSHIQAELAPGKDAFDVLKATFPAGTLTGAPKIRAMEIIEELEPTRRGPYGGAVGYLSYTGNMDLCIAIRMVVLQGELMWVQTGAGIVADSDPEKEYEETCNKAQGMWEAVRMAARGLSIGARDGKGDFQQHVPRESIPGR